MSNFVVVEGLIGVGKTSLCRLISKHMDAKLVLEPCEANPFLASFYADPKHYAFPTQMFYLAARYQQQIEMLQKNLFSNLTVADYLFDKDRIFAEQTLDAEELSLYNRFTSLLSHHVSTPNFIIFLDAPTDVILKRIERRSIDAEQQITPDYLDSLRDRYYNLWKTWKKCPIYVLDTTDINYVDSHEDAELILRYTQGWLDGNPVQDSPKAFETQSVQLTLF